MSLGHYSEVRHLKRVPSGLTGVAFLTLGILVDSLIRTIHDWKNSQKNQIGYN